MLAQNKGASPLYRPYTLEGSGIRINALALPASLFRTDENDERVR